MYDETTDKPSLPAAKSASTVVIRAGIVENGVSGLLGECALPVTGRRDVCDELSYLMADSDHEMLC